MGSVIVLGDRAAGTTTFLGLLYAALVRFGVEEKVGFRVHASHATLRAIKDVYASLVDGRFPPPELEYGSGDLSFLLGFPGRSRGFSPLSHGTVEQLSVHVADLEEVAELKGRAVVFDDWLRARLASQAILLLVDASQLPEDPRPEEATGRHPLQRLDAAAASALALVQSYQRTMDPRRRARVHPFFVLTKSDLLSPSLRSSPWPPPRGPATERWAAGLLEPRLPRTWAVLRGSGPGIRFDPPRFFVSWVATEPGASGETRVRRRLRAREGGWEPEYPAGEFLALLTSLHELADRVPLATLTGF